MAELKAEAPSIPPLSLAEKIKEDHYSSPPEVSVDKSGSAIQVVAALFQEYPDISVDAFRELVCSCRELNKVVFRGDDSSTGIGYSSHAYVEMDNMSPFCKEDNRAVPPLFWGISEVCLRSVLWFYFMYSNISRGKEEAFSQGFN